MSPRTSLLCSNIFLVLRDHGLYVVYILTELCSCGRGRQCYLSLQLINSFNKNCGCYFPIKDLFPEGFIFSQFNLILRILTAPV